MAEKIMLPKQGDAVVFGEWWNVTDEWRDLRG